MKKIINLFSFAYDMYALVLKAPIMLAVAVIYFAVRPIHLAFLHGIRLVDYWVENRGGKIQFMFEDRRESK